MKVVSHGDYYKKVIPICKKCGCRYEINKNDIKKYEKPIKIEILGVGDIWTEKRHYYTNCPECCHDNPVEPMEYEILTSPFYKGDKQLLRNGD